MPSPLGEGVCSCTRMRGFCFSFSLSRHPEEWLLPRREDPFSLVGFYCFYNLYCFCCFIAFVYSIFYIVFAFLLNPLALVSMWFLASCPFYVFPLLLAVISLSHAFPRLLWGKGDRLRWLRGFCLSFSLFCHPEGNLLPVRISC